MAKQSGYYLELEDDQDGLTIKPTDAAIEEKERFLAMLHHHAETELFDDLTNDGWRFVEPAEIGALTEVTILMKETEDPAAYDAGETSYMGTIYSDIDFYQIRSWIEELFEKGETRFKTYGEAVVNNTYQEDAE